MRYKIWQAGFWGGLTISFLLGLYKIVNAATLGIVSLPGVSYMGPPNPRHLDGFVSDTVTSVSPYYAPDSGVSLGSYILPLVMGLIMIFVFIVGAVSIVSYIVKKIGNWGQKKKGVNKK